MPHLRADQFRIKCAVNGVNPPAIASWTSMSGGDLTSEDTKVRPGGMLPQVSLGGPTTRSDAVVERLYGTTIAPYIVQWEQAIDQGMWISYTPLDGAGNPAGPTTTLHGILKAVKPPEMNSNQTGAAMLSLTMSCNVSASISL
jgi:hypothetical protein